jgi:DNA replication protein DnaC
MKDAYEVLQQKEEALARVRKEMESLNIVARLLSDDDDRKLFDDADTNVQRLQQKAFESASDMVSKERGSKMTNGDGLLPSFIASRSGFWSSLKSAR